MGQEYSSLSMEERTQLGLLQAQKLSQREIARQMGRSASTISRELARNRQSKRGYMAATAQQQAGQRRRLAKAGVRTGRLHEGIA
jgi:IS30 family transposase